MDEKALKAYLVETASLAIATDSAEDQFDPSDWAGGNMDDCYEMGSVHGQVEEARYILKNFFACKPDGASLSS